MERSVTYQEVNQDIVRVRLKHVERSCGDCRISKQYLQALEKLTHRSSERMGPWAERTGVGGPLAVGGRGVTSDLAYYFWFKQKT